ncbi:type VI secretion system-associated protein VasI [Pseudomonas cremoricolorata]|uniref:type VI secretion system-associated protein VasI n=1 Tax=Pseudomonas cremoricolorata TaxID=157783 RepID=UPI00316AE9DA
MNARNTYGAGLFLLLSCLPLSAYAVQDCANIVSNLERLACFDKSAGTPARLDRMKWSAPEQDSPTWRRVMAHEARRKADDLTFHLSAEPEGLLISAPAIATPSAYLVISCVQNISRLQLVLGQPLDVGRVVVRLQSERRATHPTPWQVMENGQVLDGGRGLPGIEQIRQLIGAHRIQVEGDHPSVEGLVFDAQGLDPLIDQARKTCRW